MQNRREDQTQRWIEAYEEYNDTQRPEEPDVNDYWDIAKWRDQKDKLLTNSTTAFYKLLS